jgi:hypothetical protein
LLRFTPDFPVRADNVPSQFVALAAATDGRFAVGDGTMHYRIRIYGDDGRVIRDVGRDIPRTRRTAEEVAEETRRRERSMARANAMRRQEARGAGPATRQPVPEEKPHFMVDALAFDPAGRLWVRTERGDLRATVFDIFDRDGRYTGELRVNQRLGRFVVGTSFIAAVTFDENEAQYVVVFRILQTPTQN